MAKVKAPKVLFFIDGPAPNIKNERLAMAYRAKGLLVVYRNARYVTKDDVSPEHETAGVMGDESVIPELYKSFPRADDVAAKFEQTMSMRLSQGDHGLNADGEEDNNGGHTLGRPGVTQPKVATVPPAPPVPSTAEQLKAAAAAGATSNPFAR